LPALINALNDEEPLVRGHVAWALGEIGTSSALEALQRRLAVESDAEVRGEVDGAINRLREDAGAKRDD